MKTSTRTQCISLCIMLAVLAMLISLMPVQENKDAKNKFEPEQQLTNIGMVNETGRQFKN